MKKNIGQAIKAVITRIDSEKGKIGNKELIELCQPFTEILALTEDVHIFHEIAEAALNLLIKTKYAEILLTTAKPEKSYCEILKPLVEKLPTQTWRSIQQNKWQQFSTPPGIAYLLTYLLNLKSNEKVLEPSAGTGNLAVWAMGKTGETITNEIDERRRKLMEILGFEPTNYNAEFINDFLSSEISPDCILMNPPFSSNGGRTKNNSSKFGFRHVESALERLKKGGKFGIILGEAGGLDTKTGNDFWRKLSDRIEVKSIIKIDGREYNKNGTTIDINLIIGRKLLETRKADWNRDLNNIISISVNNIEEAFEKVNTFNLRLNQ